MKFGIHHHSIHSHLPFCCFLKRRLKYTERHFAGYFVWVWNFVCQIKEENMVKNIQSWATRKMFGLKKKEVYNEEFHGFYSSPHIFRWWSLSGWFGRGMWQVRKRWKMQAWLWLGNWEKKGSLRMPRIRPIGCWTLHSPNLHCTALP